MKTNTLNKRLAQYSALASSFIYLSHTYGQVAYTDIEPDIILDSATQFALLDIDENGSSDFAFLNTDFTTYNYSYAHIQVQRIACIPFGANNIAASLHTLHSSLYYYPLVIHPHEVIDVSLPFHNFFYQGMATRLYKPNVFSTATDIVTNGNWYGETLDQYVGIAIIDGGGNTHYGWIRCDVKDEGRTLIVKDYAYEQQINYPITAGDTVAYTNLASHSATTVVYSFGTTVYIHCNPSAAPLAHIYDLQGKEIFSEKINQQTTTIHINGTVGIYIVVVESETEHYSQKLFIG